MLSQSTKLQKGKKRATQNIKKLLNAHQKAPLDYISPWDAQHHQILMQNNSLQSTTKNKNTDNRDNVVQNFLAKIRKMQNMRKTNRLVRNFSTEQSSMSATVATNLQPLANNVSKNGRTQNIVRSITYDAAEADRFAKVHSQPDDFGFGRLQYSKASAKGDRLSPDKIESLQEKKKKSLTYYRSTADTKLTKKQTPSDQINFHTQPLINEQYLKSNNLQQKSALFTQQQLQNPQQVVFIRKKKQNGRLMTVVNINQTAQQFYEEQLRYTEQKMVMKYRKLANKGRQYRPPTRTVTEHKYYNKQEENTKQNTIFDRKFMTETDMQAAIDRDALKKKYCFLEQLKDQSIALRMQNMLRNHPSLAQSVLIPK